MKKGFNIQEPSSILHNIGDSSPTAIISYGLQYDLSISLSCDQKSRINYRSRNNINSYSSVHLLTMPADLLKKEKFHFD